MGSVNTILQANNITRVKMAEYNAAVTVQVAGNKKEAAMASLSDFSRSLGNTLRMEAAGKQFNEATSQLAEALEARGTGKINTSLAAAERMGQLTAQASAMGVGGSSMDLLNDTVKLQRNITQDLQDEATGRLAARGARGNANIMSNAENQTDLSRSFGNFDYTVHIAPKRMKARFGKLVAVAVATYFGGPMAGKAVADLAVADWQYSNGNFEGGAKTAGQAMEAGLSAYSSWSSLQSGDSAQSWFSAVTQKNAQQTAGGSTFNTNFGNNWDWLGGSNGNYNFGAISN